MNYYQNLTAELRYRSTPESDIANILAEAQAHTPAGDDPADHFGTPAEYAERYTTALPARKSRTHPVLIIFAILAIGYVVFALLAKPVLGIDLRDYVGPVLLWPALALLLIGVTTSFLTTTFKPATATRSQ